MHESRLSGIETRWSLIRNANESEGNAAMGKVVERYGPAVKRYLLAALRNEEAADEVFQEFALRLVRGDFRNASEHKGRFRSLIKTALYHLIVDWHRNRNRRSRLETGTPVEAVAVDDLADPVEPFSLVWRETLLESAWSRLLQLQQHSGKPYHTILKLRVDHPELSTAKLQTLSESRGMKAYSPNAFRVLLHRARKRFAALLLEQVRESVQSPNETAVEMELIELGLHHSCKPVLGQNN